MKLTTSIILTLFISIACISTSIACNTPIPKIVGSNKACLGDIKPYSSFYSGYSSYMWEATNGKITKGNGTANVDVVWTTAGKRNLKLVVSDNNGCKDSVVFVIVVNNPPSLNDVNAGPDFEACSSGYYRLGPNEDFNGYTFEWIDYTGYQQLGQKVFSEKNPVLYVENPSRKLVRKYNVRITDNATGCSVTDSVHVTIYPKFKTKITGYQGCFQDSAFYSTDTLPPGAEWHIQGGTILSSNITKNILVRWKRGGMNNIILTYMSDVCPDSTVFPVRLDSLHELEVLGPYAVCTNNEIFYEIPYQENSIATWEFTNAIQVIDINNTRKKIIWDTSKTEGKIFIDLETEFGCKISKEITVKFAKFKPVDITVAATACMGDTILFKTTDTTQFSYAWDFGDSTFSSEKNPKHVYLKAGNYHPRLIVKNDIGCEIIKSTLIEVKPIIEKPKNFKGIQTVRPYQTLVYGVKKEDDVVYKWFVNGGKMLYATNGNTISVEWQDSIPNAFVQVSKHKEGFCSSDTIVYITFQNKPNGINDDNKNISFNIYPNPFNAEINIESDIMFPSEITLTDVLGNEHIVKRDNLLVNNNHLTSFYTTSLPQGIYFITVRNNGNLHQYKV
ncbi:MAG: PKD domain-containing protein, partial [Pedobacter sp.]